MNLHRSAFKYVLLLVVCISQYIFSLDGEFVFDDSVAIVKNEALQTDSIEVIFFSDFWGTDITSKISHKSYRPLTVLSFRLNKYLDKETLIPYNFKLTNLLLHMISCCLVYATYTMLFSKSCETDYKICHERFTHRDDRSTIFKEDFLAALLFTTHPIHVEAVAGAVGRADILAGIFYAVAILLYHKACSFTDDRSTVRLSVSILLYAFVMVSVVASTLCKETGIITFVICAVYEIILKYRFEPIHVLNYFKSLVRKRGNQKTITSARPENQRSGTCIKLVLMSTATLLLLFGRWAIMDFEGPTFQDIDNPAAFHTSVLARVLTYNYIYFLNFLLLIWPYWLCFDWSMGCVPVIETLTDYRVSFVLIFHIFMWLLVFRVIFNRDIDPCKRRKITISLILMVVPFLPASNILLPVGFVVAERVLYIPSIGFCMLIAVGFSSMQTFSERFPKVLPVCFVFLVATFVMRSNQRAHEWKTEYTLFRAGLTVCPLNAKVHYNIGRSAVDRKDIRLAESEYRDAIRLNPKYYQAMNNLANLLKDQKRFLEAEDYLNSAVALKVDFSAAWNNLGIVLSSMGKNDQAESAYLNAVKHRQNYPDCYYNLGNLYLDQRNHDMALEAWMNATKLNQKHTKAWSNILALLDNTGQTDRALDLAPFILKELPHSSPIHFNLGNLYGKKGNFVKAEHHFNLAIALMEEDVPAIYFANFGVLYHRWEKYKNAENMYKKALKINPTLTSALKNLNSIQNYH